MALLRESVKIEVSGADKVITLINLLDKYSEQLPIELIESLNELANCDQCEFDHDAFINAGGIVGETDTDFHTKKIISVNKILKRVKWLDDDGNECESYPEKFTLKSNSKTLIQW